LIVEDIYSMWEKSFSLVFVDRKKQEEAERIKEAKEVANKREKMRLMKEQVKNRIISFNNWYQTFQIRV